MIRGVDVWLNLPEYPLEACGTSGQKAGVNGVLNLSVLDGWWPEGYNGNNGWAIEPHDVALDISERNHRESVELFGLLEEQVVPMYFDREDDRPTGWIHMSKESMKSLLPRFNAERMVCDYIDKFYSASSENRRRLLEDDYAGARVLSQWKHRIRENWKSVSIRSLQSAPGSIGTGEQLSIVVGVHLGGLVPDDVVVECLVGKATLDGHYREVACYRLSENASNETGEVIFDTTFAPPLSGLQQYTIRIYPYHRLLSHPFELGLMKWL